VTGRLQGKTAIVTGAARGTGAAIAELFVAEGATVTIVDVLDERGEETAARLGATYGHLDVTSEDGWAELVAAHERLDVLVNNAAILHLATIDLTEAAAFEQLLRVNVLGAFLGTKAALPKLRAGGKGSIVNVGSIDSVTGTSLTSAYTATKFALRGLTKVTALENRRFGVRANILCPAAGNQEMHPKIVGAPEMPPMPRDPARGPDQVAPAAVFFASDESSLCNGTELVMDGGHSAGMGMELPDSFYGIT
jgi:3alpha(or 20beta)-hydroxysteroid dehydrogenase